MSIRENQGGQNLNRDVGAATTGETFREDGRNEMRQFVASSQGPSQASQIPDNPPCDGCSRPYCGTMRCKQCGSAFYCSKACQVSHWKSRHKAECGVLKEQNEETAQTVLGKFFVDPRSWKLLDTTGAYKAAVRQGLHDNIREVLEYDRDTLHDRYRAAVNVPCYTHWVMIVLFRDNRAEGSNSKYSHMDGQRIKAYVKSHPDALFHWLVASTQLLKAVLDRSVVKNAAQSRMTIGAEDVWKGWSDVFASPVASRSILLPLPSPLLKPKDGITAATSKTGKAEMAEQRRQCLIDHATRIVRIFLEAFNLPWTHEDEPEGIAWVNFNYAAAMLHVRLLEYEVPINAEEMFNLTGTSRHAFQNLYVPISKAMIAKGGDLSELEMCAIAERLAQGVQLSE